MNDVNSQYRDLVYSVLNMGELTFPRGFTCKEMMSPKCIIDTKRCRLTNHSRKASHNFMMAEFLWILAGRDDVSFVSKFNKNIHQFSDDGLTFFGAYGVRLKDQLVFAVKSLLEDEETRQAVVTFWRPNPSKTKDVPCTIGLHWMIRNNRLHCFSHMRSNDLWLGFPYDVYVFSQLTNVVCGMLNRLRRGEEKIERGMLFHAADSLHLYDQHMLQAKELLKSKPEDENPMEDEVAFDGSWSDCSPEILIWTLQNDLNEHLKSIEEPSLSLKGANILPSAITSMVETLKAKANGLQSRSN